MSKDLAHPDNDRDDRWYLSLMSPNTKGPNFAWLDPTSIYINGAAFHDLLDDLVADLEEHPSLFERRYAAVEAEVERVRHALGG